MASRVSSRVFNVRGWSVSPTLMRPNAPSMSPRCAVSSTALRRALGRFGRRLGAGGVVGA